MTTDFNVDNLVVSTINGNAPLSNPMTAKGDLIVGGVSGAPARLAVAMDGYVLTARASATDGVDWEPGGSGSTSPPVNAQTGTAYTLALTDAPSTSASQGIVTMTNASANVLTVPAHSVVAFPVGTVIQVVQRGAGQTSIAATSPATVENASSANARVQNSTMVLTNMGTDDWVLSGDVA